MVKQKVKLVFAKDFVDIPTSKDHFSKEIEVEVPASINSTVHLVAARVYEQENEHTFPGGNSTATIWDYKDEKRLVGKLLTYIDATYQDKEQREAHKDIIKDLVHGYCHELKVRGIQTVDSQSESI